MKNNEYMDIQDLPAGNSWQRQAHENGKRFYITEPDHEFIACMNQKIEAERIGKTVIQSYANGETQAVEHYGTPVQRVIEVGAVAVANGEERYLVAA